MNIFKLLKLICLIFTTFFVLSCSKDIHFSGVSENSIINLSESYLSQEYTKDDIIIILGTPLVTEKSGNLWIYRIEKAKGSATFKKTIYNKTLKLYFENNILRSIKEININ